jgi:hypothetical protein
VEAPEKNLVWFEHSGHLPMTEEPGKFFLSLCEPRGQSPRRRAIPRLKGMGSFGGTL